MRENGSRAGVLKLVLYSKPDCHLCHGLKVMRWSLTNELDARRLPLSHTLTILQEKIDAALLKAKYLPSELSDAEVEVSLFPDILS